MYKLLLVSIRASSAVWVATSVHRQPFVPLHLCNDSHLCRCIVQRLCVAVFMHPCITTLCGCLYASLHNDFVRPPSCILCTFMNALWALRPCKAFGRSFYKASVPLRSFGSLHRAATLCDRYRASLHDPHSASSPPQHQKKQGYACLGIALLFWCRWRGSNPHGIATSGF